MKARLFVAHALLLLLTGCSLFFRTPEITVKDVILTGLNGSGVTLYFQLAVRNPNSYDITLQGYRYNLNISAIPIAQAEVRNPVNFPGNTVTDVRLPVKIGFNSIVELMKHRPDPENVPYQLTAGFDVETPIGVVSVPLDKQGSFAIPKQYRPDQFIRKLSDIINKLN